MTSSTPSASQIDFQAIVVGAGPAGTAAAYTLAKAGLTCALMERGTYPGAKNVMGGVLYTEPVAKIIPKFWEEAPLERPLVQQEFWVMASEGCVALKQQNERLRQQPYNRYSVLRAKFDPWFARQAEEAGAYLINKTVVKELLWQNDQVVGVRTDRPLGDLYAPIVILADGVNSLLTQQAGLRKKIEPKQVALAVKEVIALPEEKILDRFNLETGHGAAIDLYGKVAHGLAGSGFIYTNRNSISIGLGIMLDDLAGSRATPYELLEELKNHLAVRPLIAGGEPREYMAHMIPEGGYYSMPKLYRGGVMVAGDAAMMVNGVHREGANLAMTSGRLAAETAIGAVESRDFSESSLSAYEKALNNSFVLKDLKKYKRFPAFVSAHNQIFSLFPEMLNSAATDFMTVDDETKADKQRRIGREIRSRLSLWQTLKSAYQGWRSVK